MLRGLIGFSVIMGMVMVPFGVRVDAAAPDEPPVFDAPLSIDNPYAPVLPGRMLVMTIAVDGEIVGGVVEIHLQETRTFVWNERSVSCRVVRTLDFEEGRFIGESRKFLAQARDGTVYFFGELVRMYLSDGAEVHTGSWLVGGASLPSDPFPTEWREAPTVYMPGRPERGDMFVREDIPFTLSEINEVIQVGENIAVSGGEFDKVLVLRETSTLEPESQETKWYAPGVGAVKIVDGEEVGELVFSTPAGTIDPSTLVPLWTLIR